MRVTNKPRPWKLAMLLTAACFLMSLPLAAVANEDDDSWEEDDDGMTGPVPEPTSAVLFAVGAVLVGRAVRQRKHR